LSAAEMQKLSRAVLEATIIKLNIDLVDAKKQYHCLPYEIQRLETEIFNKTEEIKQLMD
jgi:hypothetical protein